MRVLVTGARGFLGAQIVAALSAAGHEVVCAARAGRDDARSVQAQTIACDMAIAAVRDGTPLPPAYHRAMRAWFVLGWPAFLAVLAIYWLMVAKPALWG